ncbi:MAG: MFS transporter [Candidatus Methanoperedens sp.]|nr:MFS transporter [Candidatus Methanoperedens sp.]
MRKMRFEVKDTLTEEEFHEGLRSFIKDGLATEVMAALTGGVFLVAFALKLGASNMLIGLLAAIPPLVQLIQIPCIYLVESHRVRRKVCVYTAFSSRILWLFIALIPFLFSGGTGLTVLLIAILLSTTLSAVGGCSWNSWMHDFLPHNRLGSIFSKRMSLAIGLGIPFSLAAGLFIERWKDLFPQYELYGYSILFSMGFIAGTLGVYFVSTIPEPRMPPLEGKVNFINLILKPLKDTNFRRLIIFMSSWNFAINLAAPFFTVYMLRVLGLGMSSIVMFMVLSQIANISFLRIWGKLADRFSNKSVLSVSGPLFLLSIFTWIFTGMPGRYGLTIPLLVAIHIFSGISTAGVILASGNIGLKLAPRGKATSYLAASSFINSLAAGSAPILGGALADRLAGYELSLLLDLKYPGGEHVIPTFDLSQFDFLFLLAVLIGLFSIVRLAMVREAGEVKESMIIQELVAEVGRGVRDLSTADGLRPMVLFPYSILREHLKKIRREDIRRWIGT